MLHSLHAGLPIPAGILNEECVLSSFQHGSENRLEASAHTSLSWLSLSILLCVRKRKQDALSRRKIRRCHGTKGLWRCQLRSPWIDQS
jgi:hypothetical protein